MPLQDKMSDEAPPPYHDWTVIPDTALLPPPPSMVYHSSPATNSSRSEADRAHAWTGANPLWPPRFLTAPELQASSHGTLSLIRPRELSGDVKPIRQAAGTWRIHTKSRCDDACLLSSLPLHAAYYGSLKMIYFEVAIKKIGKESGIAVGFVAPPYPTWRMPGWERASLGVHSDDGRRFVNDTWGGRDFAAPFKDGETIGIGMRRKHKTHRETQPPSYQESTGKNGPVSTDPIEVFFTRDGREEGAWHVHEEIDAAMDQPGGVVGLEGNNDLYAAIGIFGRCDIEVKFGRGSWVLVS